MSSIYMYKQILSSNAGNFQILVKIAHFCRKCRASFLESPTFIIKESSYV